MKNSTSFLLFFLFYFTVFSQQNNVVKDYYKENFVVRAFAYSKQHYFGRLSYNNQTIYTTNMLHPHKSVIMLSSKNDGVKTIDFTNDENFLIAGNNLGNIEVWDVNKRILYKSIKFHEKAVNKVKVLSSEAASFVSAGNDGKLFFVDFQEAKRNKLIGKHKGIVRDFDISSDNNLLVSIGNDNQLILWDLKEKKEIKAITIPEPSPSSVKFVPNSNMVLVGNTEGNLYLFDKKLILNKTLKIHESVITSICALSENIFVTGSFDGKIKTIDLKDFKINELYSSKSYIINMAIKDDRLTFSNRNNELITIKI